jgi:hypothetical protein
MGVSPNSLLRSNSGSHWAKSKLKRDSEELRQDPNISMNPSQSEARILLEKEVRRQSQNQQLRIYPGSLRAGTSSPTKNFSREEGNESIEVIALVKKNSKIFGRGVETPSKQISSLSPTPNGCLRHSSLPEPKVGKSGGILINVSEKMNYRDKESIDGSKMSENLSRSSSPRPKKPTLIKLAAEDPSKIKIEPTPSLAKADLPTKNPRDSPVRIFNANDFIKSELKKPDVESSSKLISDS